MNTTPLVRVIKNAERLDPKIHGGMEFSASPNRWSTAVTSWVVEFQKRDRNESRPAFDSLLKDALPEPADGKAF
jgi:hypothetical protein